MSLLTWQTPSGNLGTYATSSSLSLQTWAISDDANSVVRYHLLSGSLPTGKKLDPITISSDGVITGTIEDILVKTTFSFTIRASDQFGSIRDRTFSITVTNIDTPKFTLLPGSLMSVIDSVYVSYDIQYSNPVATNMVDISVSSGQLPPGLTIDNQGKIRGYPLPPILVDRSPTTKTYNFSLKLVSLLGTDTASYSITVKNFRINHPPNNRTPVILNNSPRVTPVPTTDVYYDYYVPVTNTLPSIRTGDYFTFKVIGYDFDSNEIQYEFVDLPAGLTGDVDTGWITGIPEAAAVGISKYKFKARVFKKNIPEITSQYQEYSVAITNDISEDIVWTTDRMLGIINNGTASQLKIQATSTKDLVYRVASGSLPPNLTLLENGTIVGTVAFQPSDYIATQGGFTFFPFTAMAYSPEFPLLRVTKEFIITVSQYFDKPFENIYVKAAPSISDRKILATLLNSSTLIPSDYLYRPEDSNFGKASNITYMHSYGVTPATLQSHVAAVEKNHYLKKVILGPLKTAIARDDNNNIVYEVVYSQIIDDTVNSYGVSVSSTINWPTNINVDGVSRILDTSSLSSMRSRVNSVIGKNDDVNILPKWMTSQQLDGSTTGFIQAWVICFTLPGYSDTIKNNIETNWPHKLNEIEFLIDRYVVDKSTTYDWNLALQVPNWSELPSATPAISSEANSDVSIIFPRKTIFPAGLGQ